jgi:class 3 adenylate cyclase
VLHTGDYRFVPVGGSADLATRIPGAEFAELPSESLFWSDELPEVVAKFVTGEGSWAYAERELAALLMTDVVASTPQLERVGDARWRLMLDFIDDVVNREVRACHGRVVKETGDGHLAVFVQPTDALEAAARIMAAMPTLGVRMRAGVHVGEIERRRDDVAGLTVHIVARIAAHASAGEIPASRTVADMSQGSPFTFIERGRFELKGLHEQAMLLAVSRRSASTS